MAGLFLSPLLISGIQDRMVRYRPTTLGAGQDGSSDFRLPLPTNDWNFLLIEA